MIVLVINSGSSSLKFAVRETNDDSFLCKGLVERIGMEDAIFNYEAAARNPTKKILPVKDHSEAVSAALDAITDPEDGVVHNPADIRAVGHRIVHGGESVKSSRLLTPEVERIIEQASYMAPLHNPANLMGVKAVRRVLPDVPHVGVFDTAFHASMPESSYIYALDYAMYETHSIRRYGFHGTSHRFVATRAAALLQKPLSDLNCITCHLGNGCSLTAVKNGKSVDTSMGLGTVCGIPMGTRSGDIDPAVVLHLMDSLKMESSEIKDLLYKKSGLKGLSGLTHDMRDIEAAAAKGNQRAILALEVFAACTKKYIGAYATHMEGRLDAIVFTAGIGENSPTVRGRICKGLEIMGARLDKTINEATRGNEGVISGSDSAVKIFVIPTDEEVMIAREAGLLAK